MYGYIKVRWCCVNLVLVFNKGIFKVICDKNGGLEKFNK